MRKRIASTSAENCRMLSVEQLTEYTGLGRNKAIELASEIGARVSVGRRVLFDKKKLDQYFDSL